MYPHAVARQRVGKNVTAAMHIYIFSTCYSIKNLSILRAQNICLYDFYDTRNKEYIFPEIAPTC
jgi:hypothetical protein